MSYKTIQRLLLPESPDKNYDLFYQKTGGITMPEGESCISIPAGSKVSFLTYFNGFFKKQWDDSTEIGNVRVRIYAEGNCRFSFCHVEADGKQKTDLMEDWNAGLYGDSAVYQIPQWNKRDIDVCYIEAEGIGEGAILRDFQIQACIREEQEVRSAVVICTYKREDDVRKNISRLASMKEEVRPAVFLIDNGNTLGEESFPEFVRYIPNKNSGGTGGFTRGMLEVLEEATSDFTHVVLMDDDIRLETGTLERTWNFLSCLKEEYRTASVAGSLLRMDIPWMQYECGALWNRGKIIACRHHLDLRKKESLIENTKAEHLDYGGWWYCCFPVSEIREKGLPMPFFVHRDDIEYGMRMGQVLTLNGIGVWHEAFEKKLPQTAEYYDIRNMAIVNAIYSENWTVSEWKWFLRKWVVGNLLRGRYEYVTLNLYGALDFLKGEAWLQNTHAVELHQKLGRKVNKLVRKEEISPKTLSEFFCTDPSVSVYTAARKRKIIYEDSMGNCLVCVKSIWKAVNCLRLLYQTERKTNRYFEKAKESYRRDYKKLTGISFWKKYLEMERR